MGHFVRGFIFRYLYNQVARIFWLYPFDDEHGWSMETKEVEVNEPLSISPARPPGHNARNTEARKL